MLEKLQALEARYNELTEEIAKPEIIADQNNWQKLMKAHADLEPVVETYRAYRKALAALDEAKTILEEEKDDVLAVTTDLLNRKSNEKIIEFDEFAKPLLEKIHHNHEEVVFMYNMLTQKEKEWKEAAKRPVKIASESSAEPMPAEAPQKKVPQAREPERQLPVSKKPEVTPEKPKEKAPVKKVQKKIPKAVAEPTEEPVSAEDSVPAVAKKIDEVNKKIVSLHKQGKSVLDISKELNIGQGEVKLTIALYGGNK